MSQAFTFKVEGLEKLQKRFNSLPKDLQEEVVEEIRSTGREIVAKAKQRTSPNIDKGFLIQNIGVIDIPKGVEIKSGALYSPYVEFGTGGLVRVPKGLEEYAMQFKGKGIREVNLKARPFFFNSYFEEKPKLIQKLKEIIKGL